MKAIILAGGFGSRLKSVIKDTPKPMADINGTPFLSLLIQDLRRFGINEVIICVHHLKEQIINYFGNNFLGVKINYSIEETPLGTGGAILNAVLSFNLTEPFLVLNGDSFVKVDYNDFINKSKTADLGIVVRHKENASRSGVIKLSGDKITAFAEKDPAYKSGYINAGVYFINPLIFKEFKLPKSFSIETDFFAENIANINAVAFKSDDYFIDIGVPEDYKRAVLELKNQIPANKALFLDRDGVINVNFGYVHKPCDCKFIDGIFDVCKTAQDKGYILIIVTNQAGIARGYYTLDQFLLFNKWMLEQFKNNGINITEVFFCPYHKNGIIPEFAIESFDRKPAPGMIIKALNKYHINPQLSIMIGDSDKDIKAAETAEIKTKILFKEDNKSENAFKNNTKIIKALTEAIQFL